MDFVISPRVSRQAEVHVHDWRPGDPFWRPLQVYAVDPSLGRGDGGVASVKVPYEPLAPGPIGKLLEVECADGVHQLPPLDLDDPRVLICGGHPPGVANPAFHQQMVYAVGSSVYASFRSALGRLIAWGACDLAHRPGGRLLLRPHVAAEGANAAYDRVRCEIRFGYAPDQRFPGGTQFSCLSHDVIVHEMTHALIDALRSRFMVPTNPDVLGFHEGLSDLTAVFHHFLYPDVLIAQIRQVGPEVENSKLLSTIAANFGLSTLGPTAVRNAVDPAGAPLRYNPSLEAHQMGNVLVLALFDAFTILFRRKTRRYLRLAGPQSPGFWHEDLVQILATNAARLARQMLNICIRAIDYCPPLDMSLGEYLRALLTADYNLVQDDDSGYRQTIIECFANRGIFPSGVMALAQDTLLWRPPSRAIPPIAALSFRELRFNGDPSMPASAGELEAQARALGAVVTAPQYRDEFGLLAPGVDRAEPASVDSIRTARRVGPDGQVLFDLVAEVTQRRWVTDPVTGHRAKFMGGSTIVIGSGGEIRYIVSKNIRNQSRLNRQLQHQRESPDLWSPATGQFKLTGSTTALMHRKRTPGA